MLSLLTTFLFLFSLNLLHINCAEFEGRLFTYHNATRLTAFESGAIESNKALIFFEGLTDGYNGVPYLPVLNDAISKLDYSLIQIQTTSFYRGYGASSLANDAKEVDYLIDYLKKYRKKTHFVIMGHSTGCQDSYWHNKYGRNSGDVAAYILQAPASDREYYADEFPGWPEHLKLATRMRRENRGSEWMPRSISDVPVTADRFFSLYSHG
jgi:pimeloyl-ACP methyl ester carboxylesterase